MVDKTITYPEVDLLTDNGRLLYDRARSATYAAYGRLEWHRDEKFPDARQAAAAAYWQAHTTNPLDTYCWNAALYDAIGELCHTSVNALSYDVPLDDSDDDWLEHLDAVPYHVRADGVRPSLDWLNRHDLHDLVKHLLRRPSDTAVRYQAAILRLLCSGYDTAAIAVELGRTEEAIKSTRRNIRRRLFEYCDQHGIDTNHIEVSNGGWRPAHHYADMSNEAANRARWAQKGS